MSSFRRIIFLVLLVALVGSSAGWAVTRQPVTAENGMVVTSQHLASEVGVQISAAGRQRGRCGGGGGLCAGGDQSVLRQYRRRGICHAASGRWPRPVHQLPRKGAAVPPRKPCISMPQGEVVPDLSLKGYLAVGVPGSVLGLDTMLQKYGTMPRAAVMAPAIKLAEEGFVLNQGDADILAAATKAFRRAAQCCGDLPQCRKAVEGRGAFSSRRILPRP